MSDIMALLQPKQIEIIDECDEITLDFTYTYNDSFNTVDSRCVVIGYGELTDDFLALCISEKRRVKLEVFHLLPQDFVSLKGHLGHFELSFNNADSKVDSIESSQIISFAPLDLPMYKGVHTPNMYENAHSMLEAVVSLCGTHSYTQGIVFDSKCCQFQDRRPLKDGKNACMLCVDICPTMGISGNISSALLEISHIDCIKCGKCVSVCPTGSVQRIGDGLEAFSHKARLYKGFIPLIVSKSDFESPEFAKHFEILQTLNPLLLPFVLQVIDMLNITYFLTLLQESASQIVFYSTLGEHIDNDIESINIIYERIFGQKAIFAYTDSDILPSLKPITQTYYAYTPTNNETSKDVFSERMRFWIKQESYGEVEIDNFASLRIDSQKCTLCLSCVEACNTNALINNNSSFELLYKASLCTGCGYCVSSCAEDVLGLHSRALPLRTQSFEYVQIAADEPFSCIKCNKIFATTKSIEKIKHILAPTFSSDSAKLMSLECCADCKVKVMFEGAY